MAKSLSIVKISHIQEFLIPLNLACLQAYLKSKFVKTQIFDIKISSYNMDKLLVNPFLQFLPFNSIPNHQDFPLLLSIISDLRKGVSIDFTKAKYDFLCNDYALRIYESPQDIERRYGTRFKVIKQIVKKISNTDIISFTLNYMNIPEVVLASAFIKKTNPEKIIIWGGPTILQSQTEFQLFLKDGICDGFAIGEGEETLFQITQGNNFNTIPGLMWFDDNDKKIKSNKLIALDLNTLPCPDYSGINLKNYLSIASVYTSRGCTNRCTFCAEWNLFGPKFRTRDPKKVANDIEHIANKYKPKFFFFGDSLLNHSNEYFEELCALLIKNHNSIPLSGQIRGNLTFNHAILAKKAGFIELSVGFEAFTDTQLLKIHKGIEINEYYNTIENMQKAGLHTGIMLVMGFGNLENEIKNYKSIMNRIDHYSQKKVRIGRKKAQKYSLFFRPSYFILLPNSLEYTQLNNYKKLDWHPLESPHQEIKDEIFALVQKMKNIPYEFDRKIPDQILISFIKSINDYAQKHVNKIDGINLYIEKKLKIFKILQKYPFILNSILYITKKMSKQEIY